MSRICLACLCCLLFIVPAFAADQPPLRVLMLDDPQPGDSLYDLNPDLSHIGLTCHPRPDGKADFVITTTLPAGHQLFLSRNGGAPQPVSVGRFTETIRAGLTTMAVTARGPLAAGADSAFISVNRHGNNLDLGRQHKDLQPWPPTLAWRWDDPALVSASALPVVARDTGGSGDFAQRIMAMVREKAAAARVSDAGQAMPFFLLPAGTQPPSPLQTATAVVATAWRNGLPARLVLVHDANERVRWLVEFYITEITRGKWVLHDPATGAPFMRNRDQWPLAACEIIAMAAGGDKEFAVQCAGQPVTAGDFSFVAVALDNDFAANLRFQSPDAVITFVTFQPIVEEYAGLKRWSERIGIGLFIVALLGIVGIKLFGPEEPETDGDNPAPPAA